MSDSQDSCLFTVLQELGTVVLYDAVFLITDQEHMLCTVRRRSALAQRHSSCQTLVLPCRLSRDRVGIR